MNVNIELPGEIEGILRRRAAEAGQDVVTFVSQIVTESLAEEDEVVAPPKSPAEFSQRLDAWIALHPVLDHAVDDSRESIYEGRGE